MHIFLCAYFQFWVHGGAHAQLRTLKGKPWISRTFGTHGVQKICRPGYHPSWSSPGFRLATSYNLGSQSSADPSTVLGQFFRPKDSPVPCIIRHGLRLDFVSQPHTTSVPSPVPILPQDSAKASALQAEVKSLQDKRVIFHIDNPGPG
jgi:hypothetical protein